MNEKSDEELSKAIYKIVKSNKRNLARISIAGLWMERI